MTKTMVVILALATASPVLAQSQRLGALRPAGAPYRSLFQTAKPAPPGLGLALSQPLAPPTPAKPRVVCGMTVIPGDATIDPKILRSPQANGVDAKIRAIDPPICNPAR